MEGKSGTAAILATGADVSYPKENRELAAEIVKNGALASEYPLGAKALTYHFPHRNRIISGLSAATLVVEATKKSGSLITAKLALEQGRDVFAVPGSINSPLHRGCHALIKQGAKLVENVGRYPGGIAHPGSASLLPRGGGRRGKPRRRRGRRRTMKCCGT